MSVKSLIVSAVFALSPGIAFGASSEWVDVTGGKARLIIAEPEPGAAVTDAVLEVDLESGWKTYWRDPGDAGVPLQFDFSPSKNASLVEVVYPTPKRFDDGVTVWAGYDAPVAFGLKLQRHDVASSVALKGSAFFGVCDKICVPVKLEFDIEAADSAKPTIHREVVAMRMEQMPTKPVSGLQVTKATRTENHLTIEAKTSGDGVLPELFLAAPQGIQFKAPVLKSSEGSKAVFETAIMYWKPANSHATAPVSYTLLDGEKAVSGSFEIPAQ